MFTCAPATPACSHKTPPATPLEEPRPRDWGKLRRRSASRASWGRKAGLNLKPVYLCTFLLACLASPVACQNEWPWRETQPNVILTDDLDAASVSRMPRLKSLMAEQGVTFENAFVTNTLCCPSRATILRGQYSHNHQVWRQGGDEGFLKFRRLGREESTVATWLKRSGYRTAFLGKYLNGYGEDFEHVPPGWSEWHGSRGNYSSWFQFNDNGKVSLYTDGERYQPDVLAGKALGFIRSSAEDEKPFFLHLSVMAPHEPAEPPPGYGRAFARVDAPRPPSFNEEDVSDKPEWVGDRPPLSSGEQEEIDELYRDRLRAMTAVNDTIRRLIEKLKETGELDSTYIFFTSDNGWHMGQHRLPPGKWTPYEEDAKVPLIVRGPGVPAGETRSHLVLNNDFALTFAGLAGAEAPSFVDGRSLVPLLGEEPRQDWRTAFLIEAAENRLLDRPAFRSVRTERYSYIEYESGERELYDLREDPHQLSSLHDTASPALLERLSSRLEALRDCERDACKANENAAVKHPRNQGRTPPAGER
jgi:N-acetylglucosamine-6-sulfatase